MKYACRRAASADGRHAGFQHSRLRRRRRASLLGRPFFVGSLAASTYRTRRNFIDILRNGEGMCTALNTEHKAKLRH